MLNEAVVTVANLFFYITSVLIPWSVNILKDQFKYVCVLLQQVVARTVAHHLWPAFPCSGQNGRCLWENALPRFEKCWSLCSRSDCFGFSFSERSVNDVIISMWSCCGAFSEAWHHVMSLYLNHSHSANSETVIASYFSAMLLYFFILFVSIVLCGSFFK